MANPRRLRRALDTIQAMLSDRSYSKELWEILTSLRGPDSRNRKIKFATTTVIRDVAFPKRPCENLSFFTKDSKERAARRKKLFQGKEDANHFREHVEAAFESLGLKLFETN